MRLSFTRLTVALAFLVPAVLAAQAAPAAPTFRVLRIYRETVKPGKNDSHDAHENAWAGALAAAKAPIPMLAVKAMTGVPENWYLSAFPSWGDAEKADKEYAANATFTGIDKQFSAKEDEYLSDGRMMILTMRDDLSYGAPADLSSARYFSVTRISVRPGHTGEYEANRKLVKAAHESIKAPDGYSMWVAASGAPAGTYFIISPRKSLAELDRDAPIHTGDAYLAALGDSVARNKMMMNTSAAVITSQTDLFSFAPQQSIPPAEWIKADPGYWKHKAAPVKKTP